MGRRRHGRASRCRLAQGHHRRLSCKDQINPGALGLYAKDGKQYGAPFDLGMVGFWYNKAQFATAGITAPPATWDEFLTDVGKLKDAGITPIALGGKDKWPGMFWWAYLALRAGGSEAMHNAVESGDWSGPAFVQAGTELKKLDRPRSRSRKGSWPRRGTAPADRPRRWPPARPPCSSWASGPRAR